MKIDVSFLENLRLEARFDDFRVITDQPIRYKGDGSAPSPYDYFLASSALCAAYFILVYCKAREISIEDIKVKQDNIVDPENRYRQTFHIQIEIPDYISKHDREGIIKAVERCTVKRTIQSDPSFIIEEVPTLAKDANFAFQEFLESTKETIIKGKDAPLEKTIGNMTKHLSALGIKLEVSSWRNPVPNVWSVHLRDADSPMCYANGKGATKLAALASALGEFLERTCNNFFYADYFLGKKLADAKFVHHPDEKWFSIDSEDADVPEGILDEYLLKVYSVNGELKAGHLVDTNSGNFQRGICAIPFVRQSDQKTIYFPVCLVGNLFVSNGMSAGNSKMEARVQSLSEILERAVKKKIIANEMALPDIPSEVLQQYPHLEEGFNSLRDKNFAVLVKDASLGGKYPVVCTLLLNPVTGGAYASFGCHPRFEVALERSLTELLQGRSFEGLNEMPPPTFKTYVVQEKNNIIDHFIDSTGILSWRTLSKKSDFEFNKWNFEGSTQDEFSYLMSIFNSEGKQVYIADYNDLGVPTCRILVPDFSEIYEPEDLVWDNNNFAIVFREDILLLHTRSDEQLLALAERLDSYQIDDFKFISELIGIRFDENSNWGLLTVGQLKCYIYLILQDLEKAKDLVEQFLSYNESSPEQIKFFRLLDVLLEIELSNDTSQDDYNESIVLLYGEDALQTGLETIKGKSRFPGLAELCIGENVNWECDALDKHNRLLESYLKLHSWRNKGITTD